MVTNLPNQPTKAYSILITLLISALFLAGCNLPQTGTNTPDNGLVSTLVAMTQAAMTQSAQPVLLPTEVTPTFTFTPPPPTATNTPAPGAIVFSPGATAGVVQGTVQPGQIVNYSVDAGQNQPMILILESAHNDVTLGVLEPNGNKILDPANKWTRWQWLLPRTERYTIQVIGGASTENYTLTVKIAQLVNFGSGSTTITLPGTTVNGYVFSYSLNCQSGHTMTVSLNVPSTTAYIDIFGIATGSLLSASARVNAWTGVLPETQAYIIEVIPNNGQVVNYSLTVTVP